MPNDVDIAVGADSSGVARGLAEVKNQFSKLGSELSGLFSSFGAVAVFGGLVAGMQEVINKGAEIHHLSERFGIDAESMQKLGNVAAANGSSMESLARSMNKAILSQAASAEGSEKQAKAFNDLGISVDEIQGLGPEELMLRISDGVHDASDKTKAYAAVATLLGSKMGTDLIPMLKLGSKEINEQAKAWENLNNTAELHRIKIAEERAGNALTTTLGNSLSGWVAFSDAVWARERQLWAEFTGDAKGAAKAQADLANLRAGLAPGEKPKEVDREAVDGAGGQITPAAAGSSEGSTSSVDSLQLRLDKLKEDAQHRQLTNQQKLNALQEEQNKILRDYANDENATTEDGLRMNIAVQEKEKEIEATKKAINDDQEKYNEQAAEARQLAEDQANDQERQNQLLSLTAAGHADIAEHLKVEWQYEDKIDEITDRINQAWAEGDQTLAETLTKLRDQVTEEEKLSTAAQARTHALEDYNNKLASFYKRQQPGGDLSPAGALGSGAISVGAGLATDPRTGKVNQAEAVKQNAIDMIFALQGRNRGFIDVYRATQNISQAAENAARTAMANLAQGNKMKIAYYQQVASGQIVPSLQPNFAGLPQNIVDASLAQIALLKQQVAQLTAINAKLTLQPVGR